MDDPKSAFCTDELGFVRVMRKFGVKVKIFAVVHFLLFSVSLNIIRLIFWKVEKGLAFLEQSNYGGKTETFVKFYESQQKKSTVFKLR